MYQNDFEKSGLTYADVAHELGCCELTAKKKVRGETKVTKAEQIVLDSLFKGADTCMISRRSR